MGQKACILRECEGCHRTRRIKARGLCPRCYHIPHLRKRAPSTYHLYTPQEKETIKRMRLQKYTYPEIAKALGVTVLSLQHYVHRKLPGYKKYKRKPYHDYTPRIVQTIKDMLAAGHTYASIGKAVKIPMGTVRSFVYRKNLRARRKYTRKGH